MSEEPEPSLFVRFYLDEHIWRRLPAELRERGFDAVSVSEAGPQGLPDEEQWSFAAAEGRAQLTFDKRQLTTAAKALLADYAAGAELTVFTVLDGEGFHAER